MQHKEYNIFCKVWVTVIALLVSLTTFGQSQTKKPIYLDTNQTIATRVRDLLSRMTLEEKISQMRGRASAIERLGISEYIYGGECLHGVVARQETTTVFPQAIGLASTWDPSLVHRVAIAISDEARAIVNKEGNLRYLAFNSPVVNMARDPRWGRTQEGYGEDPYLVSRIGVAFVKGLQGNDPKYIKVVAGPKHFTANNDEWGRHSGSANINEQILREYYLPQFKACITEGNAQAVMAAFNAVNGIPCHANKELLTQILRNEWGFNGYVVHDAEGISDLYRNHCVVSTPEEATALGVNAGCDIIDMRLKTHQNYLLKAVQEGLIPEENIDRAVSRLLTVRFRLGMFDPPEMVPYTQIPYDVVDCKEHRELALNTAEKSIVLLKNEDDILPLGKDLKSIAIIGPNANRAQLGVYSGTSSKVVTPLEGIKNIVFPGTKVYYAKGCGIWCPIQTKYLTSGAKEEQHGFKGEYFDNKDLSGTPDLVRIDKQIDFNWRWGSPARSISNNNFSVRWTGSLVPPVTRTYHFSVIADDGVRLFLDDELLIDEWHDQSPHTYVASKKLEAGHSYIVRMEYYEYEDNACAHLDWDFEPSIKEAADIAKKSDVAIVFVGTDISVESESHDRSDMRLPGVQEDLIKEIYKANPKTIVVLINGSPLSINWTKENIPAIIEAWYPGEEGGNAVANVLFGDYNPGGRLPITFYKSVAQLPPFYDYDIRKGRTYMYLKDKPLFPFGHGLSYTKFEYSNLKIRPKIIGPAGKVYINVNVQNVGKRKGDEVVQLYVRDSVASVIRPIKALCGFKRITLKPGEKKRVDFVLTADQLAFFNSNLKRWIVAPGVVKVMVGKSSEDIQLINSFEIRK